MEHHQPRYPPEQLADRFRSLAAPQPLDPSIVRFQASATEQEIWHGALHVEDAREHVVAVLRTLDNLAEFEQGPRAQQAKDFLDLDYSGHIDFGRRHSLKQLKKQLQKVLGDENIIGTSRVALTDIQDASGQSILKVTSDHLTPLCEAVLGKLKGVIERQIDEYWRGPQVTGAPADSTAADITAARAAREREIERQEHDRFGAERRPHDSFVGANRNWPASLRILSTMTPDCWSSMALREPARRPHGPGSSRREVSETDCEISRPHAASLPACDYC